MTRSSLRLLLASSLLGAAVLPAVALAQPVETGIQVSTTPTLQLLAAEDDAKVFAASDGMVV